MSAACQICCMEGKAAAWRFERKILEAEVEAGAAVGGEEAISSRSQGERSARAEVISVVAPLLQSADARVQGLARIFLEGHLFHLSWPFIIHYCRYTCLCLQADLSQILQTQMHHSTIDVSFIHGSHERRSASSTRVFR